MAVGSVNPAPQAFTPPPCTPPTHSSPAAPPCTAPSATYLQLCLLVVSKTHPHTLWPQLRLQGFSNALPVAAQTLARCPVHLLQQLSSYTLGVGLEGSEVRVCGSCCGALCCSLDGGLFLLLFLLHSRLDPAGTSRDRREQENGGGEGDGMGAIFTGMQGLCARGVGELTMGGVTTGGADKGVHTCNTPNYIQQ